MLKFLRYKLVNSEVKREHAEQVDEESHTFENLVQEMWEKNIFTVNTEQSSETNALIK